MCTSSPPEENLGGPRAATVFRQAQAGCRESLDQLMAEHDGLVQVIVRRQVLGALPFEEGLQAGRIGLWHAILGFDPGRGIAFSTYAWPCITRQVWRTAAMARRSGSSPLSEALPLDPPLGSQGKGDPFAAWEAAALRQALLQLVGRLPGRLRFIIVAHYGLDGQAAASFRHLGVSLGLSHEGVRQLHDQALIWLQHPAHSQDLRSLLGRHSLADYQAAFTRTQAWRQSRRRHERSS